ncbi:MAG: fluoride efflux transporter CrcB [Castellaniella sp.]
MWKPALAVALGSATGGLLRWGLALRLNALFPALPPGTLVANLLAAYIGGVAIALLAQLAHLSPEWRLFIITGFCGGLSTFSTFSAEIAGLLQREWYWSAAGAITVHVSGSVAMTLAGLATVAWLRHGA